MVIFVLSGDLDWTFTELLPDSNGLCWTFTGLHQTPPDFTILSPESSWSPLDNLGGCKILPMSTRLRKIRKISQLLSQIPKEIIIACCSNWIRSRWHCETRRVGKNNIKHWNVEILMERVVFRKVIIYHLFHRVKILLISVDFSDKICNKKN